MSTNPVRIAIDARFAPALAARLTVPHKLIELDHLDDEAVRALLPNLDAVVSYRRDALPRTGPSIH